MNIKNTLKWSAAALIGAFGAGSATAQTVIHQQPFNNPVPLTNAAFSSVGWTALYHDTSGNLADYSAVATSGTAAAGVSNGNYAFYLPRTTGPEQGLFYTEAPSIQVGIGTLHSVGFTYIGDMADASFRVAVKVADQWYAQATPLVDTRDNPGAGGGYLSYENTMNFTTAANWVTITGTTIGSQMDLGTTPVTDLTGTIQAIGLYLDQTGSDHLRFDSFTVTIPYQAFKNPQTFDNPGIVDNPFSSVGWTALYHDTSGDLANYSNSIFGGGGAEAGVQTADYAYYFPRPTGPEQGLFYTDAPAIQVGIDTLYSVGFTYIGDMADASYRVAVKLDDQWYAQATPLVDTRDNPGGGGGFLTYENTMNFTTAANWVTITGTTIGSQMDLGTTPLSDLTGTIQAIGLYLDQTGSDHMRFDNFAVTFGIPGQGFDSWMAPFIAGGLTGDTSPGGDPDNDGIANLLEYALNGNPSVSDPSILPDLVVTATDFEFTYTRLFGSVANTVQTFEYGNDLVGWTPVVIPEPDPGVFTVGAATVTISFIDTATDSVKISIPRSLASEGKLFGRLKVAQ